MTKKTKAKADPAPTWIYPEDGGDGKIVPMSPGQDCPKGYAFTPFPKPEPKEVKPAGTEKLQAKLDKANALIETLEKEREGREADIKDLSAEIAKLKKSAKSD